MKKISIAIVAMVLLSGAFVASCKKSSPATTPVVTPAADNSTATAVDNSTAESHSNDADQVGAEAIDNGSLTTVGRSSGSGLLTPLSGTITITPGAGSVLVTFVNYVGMDGRSRNGSILYTYTGGTYYRDPGMTITVTTPTANPYMVDSSTVSINKTIVNNGIGASGMSWAITTTVTVTKPSSGGTFTWMCNRTKTLLNTAAITMFGNSYAAAYTNAATPISWSTALVGITGTASGTSTDGKSYTANIITQLVRDFNCSPTPVIHTHFHPFIAGEIDFTPSGKTTRQINYGTGTCDKIYTLTIGSYSTTVTMNR